MSIFKSKILETNYHIVVDKDNYIMYTKNINTGKPIILQLNDDYILADITEKNITPLEFTFDDFIKNENLIRYINSVLIYLLL